MVLTYIKVILETVFVCVMDGILHPYHQPVPVELGNVVTEPILQTLSGETLLPRSAISSDDTRLDIKTDGFRGCGRQSAFFDIRIFVMSLRNDDSMRNEFYR